MTDRPTVRKMTRYQRLRAAMLNRFNRHLPLNPIPGYPVTYGYGVKSDAYQAGHHTGEDHSTHGKTGIPVVALRDGVVIGQGIGPYYGKTVCVEFKRRVGLPFRWKTYRAYYCHLSSVEVRPGARVTFGTRLGLSGNTGNTTGPHLHMEVRRPPFMYGDDVHPFLYKRKWVGVR